MIEIVRHTYKPDHPMPRWALKRWALGWLDLLDGLVQVATFGHYGINTLTPAYNYAQQQSRHQQNIEGQA